MTESVGTPALRGEEVISYPSSSEAAALGRSHTHRLRSTT
jgi:hypothetical protein